MAATSFRIYVVEDNDWYNKLLVHNLTLNPDFEVKSFTSGAELLAALQEAPDVVTLDYRLPDMTGEELLEAICKKCPDTEVVVISEQDDIATAVDLLKAGAYDYLVKTNDIRDRLLNVIKHIRSSSDMKERITHLEKEVGRKYDLNTNIIGESAPLKKATSLIEKALHNDINVIITGETGTGKEVVAKAIHYNSDRKAKPLIAVNVAAIPDELIESELFGHEKGAFTGAASRRIGKFEEASGGTLFLDEIGEMDKHMQVKLLRVLQEKEVTRVGSNTPVKVDCRIIVATHRDLLDDVKEGRFREDLYYRLMGLPIHLPPLRERGKDVLLLAAFFQSAFAQKNRMAEKPFSPDSEKKLLSYRWPGNIRELKSVVELATVMCSTDMIEPDDISLSRSGDVLSDVITEEATLREYNIRIVEMYMKRYDDDTKKVAEKLDIGQTTVYRMLKERQENSDSN